MEVPVQPKRDLAAILDEIDVLLSELRETLVLPEKGDEE